IKQSINDQIPILIDNLEYYEDKTNNHLLSNIKAIFLFSVFFKEKSYFNLCNEVFDFIINHIFYKSGFLNEGSSHYHLLISKHVIEILYFNEIYNDNILSNKHIKFFKKVLSNIHIFSVTNNLVNFGDSTPDLPIQYLKSLTYISNKVIKINYPVFYEESNFSCKNYSNLFKINNIRVPKVRDLKYSFYDKESGYVFISNNNIKIYLQLRNSNIIKSRTHQHTEIGNFILYYKNKMIFNDLGRKNYNKNSILSLGSNYHNSFKINNLEPLLCHKLNSIPSMMHQNYFQKKPEFIFTEEQDKFKINIKFFGYERFHFKSVIERNFDILENHIIESKKQVKFNSYFHTSLNIIKKDNIYNLFENDSNLCQLKILDNNTFSIIKQNVSFNEYSINQKINSILISKKLQKKDNIKYIIKFN
ncbi:hypothetical protein OAQ39_05700, partial [Alphaproteobacteria bacterium]|nr:hypothetical protein [Alphaproteobacteria bacterium]